MNQTSGAVKRCSAPIQGLQYSQRRVRLCGLLVILWLSAIGLSACGNKGPLKLPDAHSPVSGSH